MGIRQTSGYMHSERKCEHGAGRLAWVLHAVLNADSNGRSLKAEEKPRLWVALCKAKELEFC